MMDPHRDVLRPSHQASLAPERSTGSAEQVSSPRSGVRGLRSDAYSESWIEVSSQPSSSSLSSATPDEVITSGLRVTQSMNARRRRRLHRSTDEGYSTTGSSQEGYESEGESGHIMSSSNEGDTTGGFRRRDGGSEGVHFGVLASSNSSDARSSASDDDENATALGIPDQNQVFTPQPNAFTHPPSVPSRATADQDSYFTHRSSAQSNQTSSSTPLTSQSAPRPSYSRADTRPRSHTPYNMISPNHTIPVDHDAALRASLSTLLSCAAAARGLTKRESSQSSAAPPLPARNTTSNRIDQGSLRLIPESSLEASSSAPPLPQRPSRHSDTSTSPVPNKRKSKSPSHDRRKKRRPGLQASEDDLSAVSPTLMTWVVGAGVFVLFSAISFSAGYALGKEVGRLEAGPSSLGGCAPEAGAGIKGIRGRGWRWGNASGVRA